MFWSSELMVDAPDLPVSPARRTLLLIDDDSMVGRLLGHAAEECGCEAVRTLTMASFQRQFHQRRPDIVAVDLCVPGYDGIEILRFLAAEGFKGQVLIVSGLDHRILNAALRLGAALGLNMVEPLPKPFRLQELARRLGVEVEFGDVTAVPQANDIAAALDRAIDRDELVILYQPKISLLSGAMVGAEALMRWYSPQFGVVEPSQFIPIAERSGAINELSEWGLRTVLRQWCEWREQGLRTDVAFNISALTLRDLHFPDFIERLCQVEGVPTEQLIIEVTEGAAQHATRLLDTITRFRIKGMGVELDDFGTGYSSLLQLRQLPCTGVKIDRCFVSDAASDPEAQLIVACIVQLAHGLGLSVTAEGIEDHATIELLRDLKCDQGQGYHIAAPLEGKELAHWVLGAGAEWRDRFTHQTALGTAA